VVLTESDDLVHMRVCTVLTLELFLGVSEKI
jgi:hypothetical protein